MHARLTTARVVIPAGTALTCLHWAACGLGMMTTLSGELRIDSWMGTHGLCRPDGLDACGRRIEVCVPAWERYATAVTWSGGIVFACINSASPVRTHMSQPSANCMRRLARPEMHATNC